MYNFRDDGYRPFMDSITLAYDAMTHTPFHVNVKRLFATFSAELDTWSKDPNAHPDEKPQCPTGIALAEDIFVTEYLPGRTENLGMGNKTSVQAAPFGPLPREDKYELFNASRSVLQHLANDEVTSGWAVNLVTEKWGHNVQKLELDVNAVKGGKMKQKKRV